MKNSIEFSFTEMKALAKLIQALNEAGVPYSLQKDSCAIQVTISNGF
jgi:hypothetical protein